MTGNAKDYARLPIADTGTARVDVAPGGRESPCPVSVNDDALRSLPRVDRANKSRKGFAGAKEGGAGDGCHGSRLIREKCSARTASAYNWSRTT